MLTDIGKANHIYSDGDITAIDVKTIDFDNREELKSAVILGNEDGNESIIIHSIEQWEQVNALVRKAFDGLEE